MSKYTTQVRFICESMSGLEESAGCSKVDEVIVGAIPHIFSDTIPFFDEQYRVPLYHKILKHYYTREICAETFGLWKLWLNTRLEEIMPYYNQLYRSTLIEFNPMYDVDLTTVHDKSGNDSATNNGNVTETSSGNGTQTGTSNGSTTNKNKYSNTPQGALDNVENGTYLTDARVIEQTDNDSTNSNSNYTGNRNVTNSNTATVNNTEHYMQTIVGKNGGASYSKRLIEFRQTFLNIDKMIINELSDLFFNLW